MGDGASSWPNHLELSSLVVGQRIGDGGEGEVFVLEEYPETVFKRYTTKSLAASRAATLQSLADARTALRVDGETIDKWSAWPHSLVYDQGDLVGFLMPRIPNEFVLSIGDRPTLAALAYLASEPKPIWGTEFVSPGTASRLELLGKLAAVLDVLHSRGYVYGDLSFANVVWTVTNRPRIMVLDCDGISRAGEQVNVMDTVDWQDPNATATTPTADTDCYKLSLAVLRVLTQRLHDRPQPGATYSLPEDLHPEIDQAIRRLLEQAAGPGGQRPSAAEWTMALRHKEGYAVSLPPPRRASGRPVREGIMHTGAPARAMRPIPPLQPLRPANGATSPERRVMPLLLLVPSAPPGANVHSVVDRALAQVQAHPMAGHVALGWTSYGAVASAPADTPADRVPAMPSPPVGFLPSTFGDASDRVRQQIAADIDKLKAQGFRPLRPAVVVLQLGEIAAGEEFDTAGLTDPNNPQRPNVSVVVSPGVTPGSFAPVASADEAAAVTDRLTAEVTRICDRLAMVISKVASDNSGQGLSSPTTETSISQQGASTGEGS